MDYTNDRALKIRAICVIRDSDNIPRALCSWGFGKQQKQEVQTMGEKTEQQHKRKWFWVVGVVFACSLSLSFSHANATPAVAKEVKNSIGMKFVLIPAGSFQMGSDKQSDPEAEGDEIPRHQVTLTQPFYMGKYEVTQAQWQAVMGNNPSVFKGDNLPVERVSWDDAQKFIKALNAKEGKQYRLPSEAEWEYAARAGSTAKYSFGNDAGELGKYAWYYKNSNSQTHPVGQLQPTAWGLYDTLGNVWEWCSDGHGAYPVVATTDPPGAATGSYRVYRGGGWYNGPWNLRSANRGNFSPGNANRGLGIRLVLPVQR
jgi:formylglycine-generating enzyme required for sulfatase activity